MCGSKTVDTHENSHDVGRLINMLSHQLKRQMCIREEEDSLTTNMQRLVLHYILFQSLQRDLSERCGERIPDPQVYCYGHTPDIGEERIYHERAGEAGCAAEETGADGEGKRCAAAYYG